MLLLKFFNNLTYEKRYSPHTVAAYQRDLKQFEGYLKEVGLERARAGHR